MEPEKEKILEHKITKITPSGNSEITVLPKLARALKTLKRAKYLEWYTMEGEDGNRYFVLNLLTEEEAKKKEPSWQK